jgi:hypothetical protein
LRNWIIYKINKKINLISAPIAYFHNENIVNITGEINNMEELRTMYGLNHTQKFLQNFINQNRFFYEIRWINYHTNQSFLQHRYRWQNASTLNLTPYKKHYQWGIFAFNELFFMTQKKITQFDQNRTYMALQFKEKNFTINAGCQWIFQELQNKFITKHTILIASNLEF